MPRRPANTWATAATVANQAAGIRTANRTVTRTVILIVTRTVTAAIEVVVAVEAAIPPTTAKETATPMAGTPGLTGGKGGLPLLHEVAEGGTVLLLALGAGAATAGARPAAVAAVPQSLDPALVTTPVMALSRQRPRHPMPTEDGERMRSSRRFKGGPGFFFLAPTRV